MQRAQFQFICMLQILHQQVVRHEEQLAGVLCVDKISALVQVHEKKKSYIRQASLESEIQLFTNTSIERSGHLLRLHSQHQVQNNRLKIRTSIVPMTETGSSPNSNSSSSSSDTYDIDSNCSSAWLVEQEVLLSFVLLLAELTSSVTFVI